MSLPKRCLSARTWPAVNDQSMCSLGARARHAEQQEGMHAGAQVGLGLAQQRVGRFLHDARESGHGLRALAAFGDETGLDQLVELQVDFARQGAHVRVLAQAAQGRGVGVRHPAIVPESAPAQSPHCQIRPLCAKVMSRLRDNSRANSWSRFPMDYLPVFLDLRGQRVLLVGGGSGRGTQGDAAAAGRRAAADCRPGVLRGARPVVPASGYRVHGRGIRSRATCATACWRSPPPIRAK